MSFTVQPIAMRHPLSQRFSAILEELNTLYLKKGADYGLENDPFSNVRATEEWGQPAWVGALIRATDKMRRLQKVARGGTLANESAVDSFKDLAVYAVIGLVLYEEDALKKSRLDEPKPFYLSGEPGGELYRTGAMPPPRDSPADARIEPFTGAPYKRGYVRAATVNDEDRTDYGDQVPF